jgi:hypothetical protein
MVDNLNKKIWLADNTLNPEVRSVLLKIADALKASLEEKLGINMIPIKDIVFTGSLTGPNWDEQSDIDMHFLIDFSGYDEEYRVLLEYYLLMFAGSFNENKYNILGYTVELYFQDVEEPHQSPGIYSLIDNIWIKEPEDRKIIFTNDEKQLADNYLSRIKDLKRELEETDIMDYNLFHARLDDMMTEIKEMRTRGMESELGMYSVENLVFKMLRRNGALKMLNDMRKNVRKRIYSLMKESFNINESIFVPLTDEQTKQRKNIFFSKLDKSLYDLGEATRIGWYDRVVELLNQGADPKALNSAVLRWASMYGHVEVVKLLIPVSDPKANNSQALKWASENGHVEVVKLLIPVSDPKADNSQALRWASMYGHVEVVKLLIPVSDPKANDSEALRNASENGHVEVVKILIPLSDPKVVKELGLKI